MARGQSAKNELSDDERNLLRYYAERERVIMGQCEAPRISTVPQRLHRRTEGQNPRRLSCNDCGRAEGITAK